MCLVKIIITITTNFEDTIKYLFYSLDKHSHVHMQSPTRKEKKKLRGKVNSRIVNEKAKEQRGNYVYVIINSV